jgi:hypothetical protein
VKATPPPANGIMEGGAATIEELARETLKGIGVRRAHVVYSRHRSAAAAVHGFNARSVQIVLTKKACLKIKRHSFIKYRTSGASFFLIYSYSFSLRA